ncbi:MAG: aminotransferase class I/II-fold pyridoxal phosphate-dependent enzyme [Bacteroidales bacterium]|nr:aminotransferase class I/II-fold pyridoxal phosphate-dependent enzyme [Bacteroidales bacterium]
MEVNTANRIAQMQPYYFAQKLAEIRSMQQAGKDVINLGIGNPADPPAGQVIEALRKNALKENEHGYQGYKGSDSLRTAFGHWMKRLFGVTLDPKEEVITSMGSREAIMQLSMAFLNEGDVVLVPDPGYPAYRAAAKMLQAKVLSYNLYSENQWLPDFDELEHLAGKHSIKLMWINYPHMPSGALACEAVLAKLIDFTKRHRILLVHDNPYAFVRNRHPLSIFRIPGAKEVALELHSLSKSHNMAGWRMGFIAGKRDFVQAVMKVKSNMNTGSFSPMQCAAEEALKLGEWWYRQLNERYEQCAETGSHILDMLGCKFERQQSGMFLWGRIPVEFTSSVEMSDFLLYNAGVFVAPGFIFGNNGEKYIRLSISVHQTQLEKAKQRIQNIIKQMA